MEARLTRISITLLCLSMVFSTFATAQERTYRWKDDEGNVHFGRTIPPEYATRPYEVLNKAGQVIERVDDPISSQKPIPEIESGTDELEPLFTEDEVRLSSDNLLILRYNTEEDLVAAMENEVAQLGYDRRLINQSRSSAMTTLAGLVKNAADRHRAGMPDDEALEKGINSMRQRLRRSETELTRLNARELKIRGSFEENIARYQYLANGGIPGGTAFEDEPDSE
jgi:hypothetical protein